VTSFPDIAEQQQLPRIVRGYGITHPFSSPYLTPEQEAEQRRAILEMCLYALTQTPTRPTVFWPNYGNCIGTQVSSQNPQSEVLYDWDWTIL
jgi:hypothetical protein